MDLLGELKYLFYFVVDQFKMIFPYWIIGMLAGAAVSAFGKEKIKGLARKLQDRPYGIAASLIAALLGAASPMCMYGTIPLIATLGMGGVPEYILVTFMISSILINPNLFLFSFALGTDVALIRLVISILAGMTAGILVRVFYKNRTVFNFAGFHGGKNSQKLPPFKKFIDELHGTIVKTTPYVLAGIVLTALINRFLPQDIINTLFDSNNPFGVVVAATIGVPVYLCGGGTIPLIKSWMLSGMSLGAAAAFMLTGPATKMTNLSAIKSVLGTRNFIIYVVFIIAFALAAGWITDIITMIIK